MLNGKFHQAALENSLLLDTMKIILLADVRNVGRKGDVKEVADGFARNFLIPRQLAKLATPNIITEWQQHKALEQKRGEERHSEIQTAQKKLESTEFRIEIAVGEKGKAFKGIGAVDISAALKKHGFDIPKAKIEFPAVKEPGSYAARIHLGENVIAHAKIILVAMQS